MIINRFKCLLAAVAMCVAFTASAQPARAQSTTLAALAAGGTITSGNLLFSNFNIQFNQIIAGPGAGGAFVNPALVAVASVIDFNGNNALIFVSPFIVANGQIADLAFNYTVTSTNGTLISDLHSNIVGSAIGGPGNFALLAETVTPGLATDSTLVGVGFTPIPVPNSSKIDLSTPGTSFIVSKDFLLLSTPGGLVFVSDFTQGFSKQGDIIPEPSSIALISFGVLGLIGYGWRRRKMAKA